MKCTKYNAEMEAGMIQSGKMILSFFQRKVVGMSILYENRSLLSKGIHPKAGGFLFYEV